LLIFSFIKWVEEIISVNFIWKVNSDNTRRNTWHHSMFPPE